MLSWDIVFLKLTYLKSFVHIRNYQNSNSINILYFPETNEIKISKSLFFMKISYHWPNHQVSLDTE
jgi:hypothetical protein